MPCNVDENAALRVDGVTHAKSLRAVAVEAFQEHRNVDTEAISSDEVRRYAMAICNMFVHGT